MTLTTYGRIVRKTRPMRVCVGLLVTAPIWVPLVVLSYLKDHWPEIEQ